MLLELVKAHVAWAAAYFEHQIILGSALLKIEYFDCVQYALVDSEFIDAILV
jgi:hypothetical protein